MRSVNISTGIIGPNLIVVESDAARCVEDYAMGGEFDFTRTPFGSASSGLVCMQCKVYMDTMNNLLAEYIFECRWDDVERTELQITRALELYKKIK